MSRRQIDSLKYFFALCNKITSIVKKKKNAHFLCIICLPKAFMNLLDLPLKNTEITRDFAESHQAWTMLSEGQQCFPVFGTLKAPLHPPPLGRPLESWRSLIWKVTSPGFFQPGPKAQPQETRRSVSLSTQDTHMGLLLKRLWARLFRQQSGVLIVNQAWILHKILIIISISSWESNKKPRVNIMRQMPLNSELTYFKGLASVLNHFLI